MVRGDLARRPMPTGSLEYYREGKARPIEKLLTASTLYSILRRVCSILR
jgi:hypothetical protein